MRLARKPRRPGDIDVTSFSDIAFLMIIFFVLTTTFTRQMGATISIPSSTSDPQQKSEGEFPTINLSRDRLLLDESAVTMDELRQRLGAMKLGERKEAERFVVLESTPDVEFERYFQIVTAISKAGGILALVEEEEKKQGEDGEGGSGGGEAEGAGAAGSGPEAGRAAPPAGAAPGRGGAP